MSGYILKLLKERTKIREEKKKEIKELSFLQLKYLYCFKGTISYQGYVVILPLKYYYKV